MSFREIHAKVTSTNQEALEAVKESGRLIQEALEAPPGDKKAIESALEKGHEAFLEAKSALAVYKRTLKNLEGNNEFMASEENRAALEDFKKLTVMSVNFQQQIKNQLEDQELAFERLRTHQYDSSGSKKNSKNQKL